jgi:hypothetical protein
MLSSLRLRVHRLRDEDTRRVGSLLDSVGGRAPSRRILSISHYFSSLNRGIGCGNGRWIGPGGSGGGLPASQY